MGGENVENSGGELGMGPIIKGKGDCIWLWNGANDRRPELAAGDEDRVGEQRAGA